MPHARKSAARRGAASRPAPPPSAAPGPIPDERAIVAEIELVHDKRAIANLFATWHISRCGREGCARAKACVGPDAICFDENRHHLIDAMHDLLASRPFVEGGKEPGEEEAEGDPAG